MIYLFGSSGFIGKNLYLFLKKNKSDITLLNRNTSKLDFIKSDDVLINCCGVNRCNTYDEYENGNVTFITNIIEKLKETPFLIHLSSFMITGYELVGDKLYNNDHLSDYQKWFILSKLKCEKFLEHKYPDTKLCIIRPSNIYGYNCEPYYNNILSTLIYEKITKNNKITNINKNSIRNFLSIEGLCESIHDIIKNKKYGYYNIISNNNVDLCSLLNTIYDYKTPDHITISNGNIDNNKISNIENMIVNENINSKLKDLEKEMTIYLKLKNTTKIKSLQTLSQERGEMVEIVNDNFKRLYKITINKNQIRGEHYHNIQTEQFYINNGTILFLFAYPESKNVVFITTLNKNDIIQISPGIIHTVCNDYIDNENEIFITSTQEFIERSTPDTIYVKILE